METKHKTQAKRTDRQAGRLWAALEIVGAILAGLAIIAGVLIVVYVAMTVIAWSARSVHGAFSDEPSETYQCLVDTYLTDHHNINLDTSDNYSISSNGDALWLHVDKQPILKIDDAQFAEGISRC